MYKISLAQAVGDNRFKKKPLLVVPTLTAVKISIPG